MICDCSNIPYELFRELSKREDRYASNRAEIPRIRVITLLQKSVICLNASTFGDLCVGFYGEM